MSGQSEKDLGLDRDERIKARRRTVGLIPHGSDKEITENVAKMAEGQLDDLNHINVSVISYTFLSL